MAAVDEPAGPPPLSGAQQPRAPQPLGSAATGPRQVAQPYGMPYPAGQPYWIPPGGSASATSTGTMGTASGVLGIVGLAMVIIPVAYWFFYKLSVIDGRTYLGVSGVNGLMGADFVVSTLGIVFGAVSLSRSGRSGGGHGRGLSRIGVVLGALTLVLATVFLPLVISAANAAGCSVYPSSGC